MKTLYLAVIILVAVIVGVVVLISRVGARPPALVQSGKNSSQSQNSVQSQNNSQASGNSTGILFSGSQYAPYSYIISDPTLSQQAMQAISGFNVTRTVLSNGSVSITLTYIASGSSKNVILAPGYKMYFLEGAFADDNFRGDTNIGDDAYLVVNSNGYIVTQ